MLTIIRTVPKRKKITLLEPLPYRCEFGFPTGSHNQFQLKIDPNNNNTVTRSFKVYEDIYKEFMELSKEKYKTYKMQDLISQAIKEFCNKYK